jgi:hypothetical protein
MTPAGYSETPLIQKLGFKPGDSVYVEDTPAWYSELMIQNDVDLIPDLPATHAHIFCDSKATLKEFLESIDLENITQSLWVSWLKKSSGIKTDLAEQDLRDMILPLGWVDTKVAAMDDSWSGLKFVRRKN